MSSLSQVLPGSSTFKKSSFSTRSTVVAVALAALLIEVAGGSLLHFQKNRYAGWGLIGVGSALLVGDVVFTLLPSKVDASKANRSAFRRRRRPSDPITYKIVSWNARVREQVTLAPLARAMAIAEKIERFIDGGAHLIALQKVEEELPLVGNWTSVKAGSAALIYDETVFKIVSNLSKTDCPAIQLRDSARAITVRVASVQEFDPFQAHLEHVDHSTLDLVACRAADEWRKELGDRGYLNSKDNTPTFRKKLNRPAIRAHEVFGKIKGEGLTLTSRVEGHVHNLELFAHLPFSVEVGFAGGVSRLV